MIDAIDRNILRLLQTDARQSATAIAAEVGLTVAPTVRRIKELERAGVIRGYRAEINPGRVGLGFEAVVFVTLTHSDKETIVQFEAGVQAEPSIVEAQRLFGEVDYVFKVVARDLPDYQRLYDEVLSGLPGVQRLNSTIVMKNLTVDRTLPL